MIINKKGLGFTYNNGEAMNFLKVFYNKLDDVTEAVIESQKTGQTLDHIIDDLSQTNINNVLQKWYLPRCVKIYIDKTKKDNIHVPEVLQYVPDSLLGYAIITSYELGYFETFAANDYSRQQA